MKIKIEKYNINFFQNFVLKLIKVDLRKIKEIEKRNEGEECLIKVLQCESKLRKAKESFKYAHNARMKYKIRIDRALKYTNEAKPFSKAKLIDILDGNNNYQKRK